MCPANGLPDCLRKARPTWSYERRPPYQERGSREGYFHQSWLLPRVRLQERQEAASSSASPSRGEAFRLLPAPDTAILAERAFLSEVALSSVPADTAEEEGIVSPSVPKESGSAVRAAGAGVVYLSKSEDHETVGAMTPSGQVHTLPRWADSAQVASVTHTLETLTLAVCSGDAYKQSR